PDRGGRPLRARGDAPARRQPRGGAVGARHLSRPRPGGRRHPDRPPAAAGGRRRRAAALRPRRSDREVSPGVAERSCPRQAASRRAPPDGGGAGAMGGKARRPRPVPRAVLRDRVPRPGHGGGGRPHDDRDGGPRDRGGHRRGNRSDIVTRRPSMALLALAAAALLSVGCEKDKGHSDSFLFENNAQFHDGRTARGPNLPIRVFLGNGVASVGEVTVWTAQTGGLVTFTFVGSPAGAGITFGFRGGDDICGVTDVDYTDDGQITSAD